MPRGIAMMTSTKLLFLATLVAVLLIAGPVCASVLADFHAVKL